MFKYRIFNNRLKIIDSYKINSKNEMLSILSEIKQKYPNYDVCQRTDQSLIDEWAAHNMLYKLNISKEHTADVDFESQQKIIYKIIYKILCRIFFILW